MTYSAVRLLAATLCLLSLRAVAQVASPAPDCTDSGVWFGTVGDARVSLAFSDGTGRYYYGNSVQDLVLTRDPAHPNHWLEADTKGKRTGDMTLTCGAKLEGRWTTPGGDRARPVVATPFLPGSSPLADDEDPRHSQAPVDEADADPEDAAVDAYLREREAHPPAVRRIPERIGPHRYVRYGIHGFGAVSVELQGPEPGIAAINAAIRPKYAAALEGAWACRYWTLVQGGPAASENFVAGDRVAFWHGSTVAVESWNATCARDTEMSSDELLAFDTRTGGAASWPFPYAVIAAMPLLPP
jgi:hypothetical protein